MFEDFTNENGKERIARIVLGVVASYLGFSEVIGGGFGAFLGVLGLVTFLTGVVGWCPVKAMVKAIFTPRANREAM